MPLFEKFSQFQIGGSVIPSDIIVGLRSGVNTQFDAPISIVKTWNHLTAPVDVNAGRNISITGGVIGTSADVNVVTAWNGSTTPVAITAGNNIDITNGVISATEPAENVVTAWNGSTNPIAVTAGTGISITSGVITNTSSPPVVTSWNGSTTPVAITAGFNVDITNGVISATGALGNVVTEWDGSISPVEVTAGTNMDITDGVISTTAQPNVVTSWNGSSTPVAVTAGSNITITGGVIAASLSSPQVVTAWNGSTSPVAVTAGQGTSLLGGVVSTFAAVNAFGSMIYNGNTNHTTFTTAGVPVQLVIGGGNTGFSFGSYEADFSTGVIRYLGSNRILSQFNISLNYTISPTNPYNYIVYPYHYINGGTGWVRIPNYQKTIAASFLVPSEETVTSDIYLTGIVQLSPGDRLGIWVSNTLNTNSFLMINLSFTAKYLAEVS